MHPVFPNLPACVVFQIFTRPGTANGTHPIFEAAEDSSVLRLIQITIQQLGVGVVSVQPLLLLQFSLLPFVLVVHAEQAEEQREEERGDATGDQYPRGPRLFRLYL